MNHIMFDYSHAGITDEQMRSFIQQLKPVMVAIKKLGASAYQTDYASLAAPFDRAVHDAVITVVKTKKKLQPVMLIVVGIGGSHLGTLAVQQAVRGVLYNDQQPPIAIYYADTIDTDYSNDILLLAQQALKKDQTVLLNIISKSGNTTETIVNAELFIQLFQSFYGKEYHEYIIVTTDHGSPLAYHAQENKYTLLPIEKNIGGRFSVFSAVGLFPLALIGIDIALLMRGAADMITYCNATANNDPAKSASILFAHYKKNIAIHNTFIFSVDLQGVGAWYRQLMAESLGKAHTIDGQKKAIGILPTVSMGSADLHSQVQLYLAGPAVTMTTFLSVKKNNSSLTVPARAPMESLVPHIGGKSLPTIMAAILQGVQHAYTQLQRPYCSMSMPEKTAYFCGQLLQWKMMEIIYLAALLEVNPFDQPQVELYKKETRKILAHE